jgi:hypothetical protein
VVGDPRIVRAEFHVDGRRQAVAEGPPWKAEVDFGALAPHRLEVFGFGADGTRLARAEQWVNLPRPTAEARLIVEQDESGKKTYAVLKWENVLGLPPTGKTVELDGRILESTDGERYRLPETDPTQLHFLAAELAFEDGSTAHAEASFGGQFGGAVETELTAFVVRKLAKKAKLEGLYGCFTDREGKALQVAAAEKGAAEVMIVRDRGAEKLLTALRRAVLNGGATAAHGLAEAGRQVNYRHPLRFEMRLDAKDRVRLVWPNLPDSGAARRYPADRAVFESSTILDSKLGGMHFFVTQFYPEHGEGDQHLAYAVALAGLQASAEGRRRAVVLVLGGAEKPADRSAATAQEVEKFLEILQVPLVVWTGGKDGASTYGWPAASPVGTLARFDKAFWDLKADLDAQVVVWLNGRHLAAEVRFDAARCPDFTPLSVPGPG